MKIILQYGRFFWYVSYHWHVWLALFILFHDIKGYFRYRIRTFAPEKLKHLTIHETDLSKSSPYEAVNYYILEKLLTAFTSMTGERSLVDLGCGKGRVLVVSAYYGFTRITGIDFAAELCREAMLNMKKTQKIVPGFTWRVYHANVLDYPVQPGDSVFFMFNPFIAETLNGFIDKLEMSCLEHPRRTWFLYASPQFSAVLESRGYREVYRKKMMLLEGKIFCKD